MHPVIANPEVPPSMRLSRTQADLLTDMGVTVWLSRSAGPLADEAGAPEPAGEFATAGTEPARIAAASEQENLRAATDATPSLVADSRRGSALKPELVAALSGATKPPVSTAPASTSPASATAASAVPASAVPGRATLGPSPTSGDAAGTVIRGARIWGAADAALLLVVATPAEAADATVVGRGRPGPLLTAMLASIDLAPEQVAVAIAHGQGEPLGAARVLLLGERACQAVLGMELARARARAHVTSLGPVVATDHPDALRRHAALKRLAWDDLRVLASLAPAG